jgi:hypothetical protein
MLLIGAVIAAVVGAAAPSGTAAPPDGTYTYSITQAGTQIGTSTVTIKRSSAGISVHEDQTLGVLNFVIDETVDGTTLDPTVYVATYSHGAGSQARHVAFDRTGATVSLEGVSGSQFFPLTDPLKNVYVLESSILTGYFLLPAQIHASKATQFLQIIPSEVESLTAHVSSQPAGSRPSDAPASAVDLSIGGGVNFDEWYDPNTFVLNDVSVPIQDLVIKLTK